jgi:hypothetical protein
MLRMTRTRRSMEWRYEPGPGYDLRQYWRGKPTGVVAATMWHGRTAARKDVLEIPGQDVLLIIERSRITVYERCMPGRGGVRIRLPLRSCVDAQVLNEPGLPGAMLIRLNLTVRIGTGVTLTVPMWFPVEQGTQLYRLVDHLRAYAASPNPHELPLPLTDTEQAPDSPDWVVFRPHPSSGDVPRKQHANVADDAPARSIGETR